MSTFERIVWAVCGTAVAAATAVQWWRDEREIRRIRRDHQAEMEAIRRG